MDRQERPVAAGAVAMDGAGDQFLAGAAFAGDEDAGVARRHQGDALEDGLHRRAAADESPPVRRPSASGSAAAGSCSGPALQRPVTASRAWSRSNGLAR